ncbi:hypothetical protein M9Y10_026839 [Tritrichomonas musculus]|uniref:Calcineurin-like phosphoesterase domain-containing protein n=1 Tax=Tritrichomonas musculus TaxID=1915356 RepID=A0ABR2H828_9EUKA
MLLIKKKKKESEDTDEIEDNHCDEYFANHVDTTCYKYTENLYDAFISAFSYLPISATVNKTSFCIHGGICPKLDRIDNINTMITRLIFDFEENSLFTDVVWSDPSQNEEVDTFSMAQ